MNSTAPTPSPIAAIFKARRKELDMSQTELARLVATSLPAGERFTQQSYASFESGKTRNTRYVVQIAAALGIPAKDLYIYVDEAHRSTASEQLEIKSYSDKPSNFFGLTGTPRTEAVLQGPIDIWDDSTPLDEDEVEVPLLKEVELSAGNGREASQSHAKTTIRFGARSLRSKGVDPQNAVCVTVTGNSMEPVLPNGSTAGVDRGRTTIKDGEMYALLHNDQLRVKVLYNLPSGGIRMRSFNRDEYPDEEYSPDRVRTENVQVYGRIFWYSVLC